MPRFQTFAFLACALGVALPGQAAVVLVDNTDPEASFMGTWPTSTYSSVRIGDNYQHSGYVGGLTATYTPDLSEAGMWQVEAFWNSSAQRGDDVPYTVNYDGGSTTVYRDQRSGGGVWNNLGAYNFAAGTGGNVVISSTVSNGETVIADAIRFTTFVPPPPLPPGVIDADADTYIQGNGSSHGTATTLLMKSEGVNLNWSRKAYVRFDLDSLGFDHTSDLDSATLNLNFVGTGIGSTDPNETYDFELFGLNDGAAGQDWDEASTVWNNAPGNDTASHDGVAPGETTSLGTFSLQGQGIGLLEFTSPGLTSFVQSDTDGLLTFIVVRHTPQNGTGGVGDSYTHGFSSRESSFVGPQLVLEQRPVPEPATWLLLGLGGLGLAVFARRRR